MFSNEYDRNEVHRVKFMYRFGCRNTHGEIYAELDVEIYMESWMEKCIRRIRCRSI